mmetsp:Transcript_14534/g.39327  ORF Transcript_14534/g.39327 Transcript_14534/m.39327 type:complete len:222 (-) Transcript_14534:742-1407(-)
MGGGGVHWRRWLSDCGCHWGSLCLLEWQTPGYVCGLEPALLRKSQLSRPAGTAQSCACLSLSSAMPSPSAPCRSIFGSGPLRQTPSSFPWRYASAQPARHSPPSHAAHFRPPQTIRTPQKPCASQRAHRLSSPRLAASAKSPPLAAHGSPHVSRSARTSLHSSCSRALEWPPAWAVAAPMSSNLQAEVWAQPSTALAPCGPRMLSRCKERSLLQELRFLAG